MLRPSRGSGELWTNPSSSIGSTGVDPGHLARRARVVVMRPYCHARDRRLDAAKIHCSCLQSPTRIDIVFGRRHGPRRLSFDASSGETADHDVAGRDARMAGGVHLMIDLLLTGGTVVTVDADR